MDRGDKSVLTKKKVSISTKGTSTRSRKTDDCIASDIMQQHIGGWHHFSHAKENWPLRKQRSVSDLMTELILNDYEKENMFDPFSADDIRKKPDLWMAAFDNPVAFIEYCRKRLDHERELLEKSRQVEDEVLQFVKQWTQNTDKHANTLKDLFKVQDINDKLQEVIMEERTHCQHLVGINDHLDTQRQIMSRKYQAALLLGKVDEKSVHHLLEKNPKAVPLADRLSDLGKKIKECDGKYDEFEVADPTVLVGRVKTLEKSVDDLMRQHREETLVLKETISQGNLKCQSIKAQYTDLLQRNAKSLSEMKEVLGASIRENLDLREQLLKKDSEFFEHSLTDVRDTLRKTSTRFTVYSSSEIFKSPPEESTAVERERQVKLAKSEIDLAKKANLLRETVNKVVMLERKCSRLEEENQLLRKANERSIKALKTKNAVLEKRCENTESRLKLEKAGCLHEIRECKTLMKLLIRNVKSYTKEQVDIKRKLSENAIKANTEVQKSKVPERTKGTTTQTGSDVRLHAMNLWLDYLGQKVENIEETATSSRNYQKQHEDVNVLSVHPPTTTKSKEGVRVVYRNKNMRRKVPSEENMLEDGSLHSMPPYWIIDSRLPENYAHLLDGDQVYEDLKSPPPLD